MNTVRIASSLALSAALLGGCGSSNQNAGQVADARSGSDQSGRGQLANGGEHLASSCSVQPVYFDYDSSTLDQRSRGTLEQDAQCLNQRQSGAQITGMADPRGTEEYNLALGEGRARSVHHYLTQLGVDEARASFRSMGEEMATGQDEASWARDRRADIEMR